MSTYVATFYTHLSAQLSCKRLRSAGCEARMMPVPRALSSSCGTCVRYEGEGAHRELLDADAMADGIFAPGGVGTAGRIGVVICLVLLAVISLANLHKEERV